MSIKARNLCLPIVISTEEQSSFSKLTSQMLEPFCLIESRIGAFFNSGRFRLTLFYRLFVGDPFPRRQDRVACTQCVYGGNPF